MTHSQRNPEDQPIAALLAPDILALLEESPADVAVETEEMHPADLADVVEAIPFAQARLLLTALPPDRAADVLEYLEEDLRREVLDAMTAEEAALLVAQMTPDDRVDVLEEMDEERAEEILEEIPDETRRETEQLRRFDPDTAGGLMTTEFVSVPADCTVDDALERVRQLARNGRREAMYALYTTDEQGRLVGVLSLRELLAAAPGARITDIAWSEIVRISPSASREEVARVTANYDLVAVPVVSESGHIMGVVTVDDVIDVIQEEQTEDVQKMGGMEALDDPYMDIGLGQMIRKRIIWLSVLFVGSLGTATVIGRFQAELGRAAVLIAFMPLIISSGGNSGSQATSLIIRAMALGEVTLRDWIWVARRELASGFLLGTLLGMLGAALVLGAHYAGIAHFGMYVLRIAATIGTAICGVVTFGSVVGSMLPFLLRRLGFDPASASAPFVATLVDVTGLVIYFSVSLLLLRGTLL
jgi:magnesium transporter